MTTDPYEVTETNASTGVSKRRTRQTEAMPVITPDTSRVMVDGGWYQARGKQFDAFLHKPGGQAERLGGFTTKTDAIVAISRGVARLQGAGSPHAEDPLLRRTTHCRHRHQARLDGTMTATTAQYFAYGENVEWTSGVNDLRQGRVMSGLNSRGELRVRLKGMRDIHVYVRVERLRKRTR